jgi:predicted RNA-binding protein with PUA-like domain
MTSAHWLLKTEPETYSFARLRREKRTNWCDVRNFQARNFLKEVAKGDFALIYHSGAEKAVVGIARCVRAGYPDIDADDGKEWVQIDLAPVRELSHPVPLATIKATPALRDLLLIRQSRLSVMPVTKAHFDAIVRLSEKAPKQ